MIGQTAMNTIIPKATSSEKYPGCALYAWRSLKKRETRKSIELVGSTFMSTIDNPRIAAFHRKGNVLVTLVDGGEEADSPAAHSP